MYNTYKRLLVLVVSLGMISAVNATMLFSETFDSNEKGWTVDSNWQISDGVYKFTSPVDFHSMNKSYVPFGLVSAEDLETEQYTVSYDFRFLNPWVGFRIGASWEDVAGNENKIVSRKEYDQHAFYSAPPGPEADKKIEHSYTFSYDQWHNAAVTVDAGYVRLYLDGSEVAQGDFTLLLYDMDVIGFGSWRANADFDNLTIQTGLVPEPTSLALLGIGLFGVGFARRCVILR